MNSETKFTKGDWQLLPLEDDKEYIRIRGTVLGCKYKIADVDDMKHHHSQDKQWCKLEREEAIANAHLIAAAPELYAMLDRYATTLDFDGYKTDDIKELLAKARGEK
jgi:hypothetical protein